jgi:hypothetical protein
MGNSLMLILNKKNTNYIKDKISLSSNQQIDFDEKKNELTFDEFLFLAF